MSEFSVPDPSSPAARRRLRVRAAILDAAEKVFAEEGEDGLSIRRLAEEIDYSPAAIYKYFGSKEELVDELKELFFDRILARVAALRACDAPYPERARNCLFGYVMTALEKPQHYLAAFAGVQENHLAVEDSSSKARAFDFLTEMVQEGQRLGHIKGNLPPVTVAKSLWASLHGAASLMAHLPDFLEGDPDQVSLDRKAFLELHADMVLKGLMSQ